MSASSTRPSYAAVLRMPYAKRTFTAALVGRLSYGTVSLAVMLAVSRATGSYAVAGTVMALFGAASVFLTPCGPPWSTGTARAGHCCPWRCCTPGCSVCWPP